MKMKVKDLIKELKSFPQNYTVTLGSDEELNQIFDNFDVAVLSDDSIKESIVIYGWGDPIFD